MPDDYMLTDAVEGWALELGDFIVTVDSEGETHHLEVEDLIDSNTDFDGQGYCFDHDQTCYFTVGSFDQVPIWSFNQEYS